MYTLMGYTLGVCPTVSEDEESADASADDVGDRTTRPFRKA